MFRQLSPGGRGVRLGPGIGHSRKDRLRNILRTLVLPESENRPPEFGHQLVSLSVASTIPHDFVVPEALVDGRSLIVLWTAMSIAAINEIRRSSNRRRRCQSFDGAPTICLGESIADRCAQVVERPTRRSALDSLPEFPHFARKIKVAVNRCSSSVAVTLSCSANAIRLRGTHHGARIPPVAERAARTG